MPAPEGIPTAASPAWSACDALRALRSAPPDAPVAALISAGAGEWSRRSLVTGLGERLSVDNPTDLPRFWTALGPRRPDPGAPGGWVGCLDYSLGALLEPAAGRPATGGPHAELWRASALPPAAAAGGGYSLAPLRSAVGEGVYTASVARALAYIAAGDVYQVNLTHPLCARVTGDTRALAADAIERTGAWFGAYLHTPERTIVSTSPELLVRVTPGGRISARPVKGTRPLGAERELAASQKDAAELAMIVDLMRNDLGRVCALGSVRVEQSREIEGHAGVAHTVATVSGQLRDDASWEDVLRAVFPAGSITGAPKIRAMQIIDQLEPEPRGLYCGSIAWIGDDGSMDLSVAIRTAVIRGGELRYGVGAGIVADSDPQSEWRETLQKAEGFARAVGSTLEG